MDLHSLSKATGQNKLRFHVRGRTVDIGKMLCSFRENVELNMLPL
jgi:hypothetical protein